MIRETRIVNVGGVSVGGKSPMVLIAGPCVIESRETVLRIADKLQKIAAEAGFPLIFKASYDKANRTSLSGYRGPGLHDGIEILADVRERFKLPVLSDVHSVQEIADAAGVLDILQIPAFLSRQTDLLVEAGRTGKPVNIKKGQFMAPWDISNAVEKAASTGNNAITLTERGVSFGYNNLVVDMRSLQVMRDTGCPVVFDATHSVQLPGGQGRQSGGQREFVPVLCRAAAGAGCDALFLEVHDNLAEALCDAPNMVPLEQLRSILDDVRRIDAIVRLK